LGLRFRRSVSIFPGVRLNFSGSGISTSVGVKGATVNFGRHGQRTTLGLPGTGLSHSTFSPNDTETHEEIGISSAASKNSYWLGWLLGILGILSLAYCAVNQTGDTKTAVKAPFVTAPTSAMSAPSEEETVNVTHAGGRATPDRSGRVVVILRSGERVRVVKTENGWKQVVKDGITFWILAKQLSATATPHATLGTAQNPPLPNRKSAVRPQKKKRQPSSAVGCSCSSTRVCTGPRGGRYCLTANGNKVYGQ
jgi:Protein of unknown function (DUF4236)/Bacterial SH3 domain